MTKKAGNSASSIDVFSTARLRELLELMKEYDLNEIDLMEADQQIRLSRGGQAPMVVSSPMMAAPAQPVPANVPVGSSAATSASNSSGPTDGAYIKTINSPMVGTFYSKPKPTAEDYVKVGSKVSPETVVCIVEAMKVYNEIPAEISGTIVEVLVKNDQPVDFNRPLFKVDTRS